MNRKELIKNVEDFLNDGTKDFMRSSKPENVVDEFLYSSCMRLVITYAKFTDKTAGNSDLLACLRNFLICMQTGLKIESKAILELLKDNCFGIQKGIADDKYYAFIDAPPYIRYPRFIQDAFITKDTELPSRTTEYNLKTNGFIQKLVGYSEFKSMEQKLCVYGSLNLPAGYTALVSMPTGGGKSLITQAVAYQNPGMTIAVMPTISLTIDQQNHAKDLIKCDTADEVFAYYTGSKNLEEITTAIKNKRLKLLFVSPESLMKNENLVNVIRLAAKSRYLKNIIIDEAHLVIAWGNSFRMDYQCLQSWRFQLIQSNPEIRTFLLSATFSRDTVHFLKIMFSQPGKWVEIRCDSLRREPRFICLNEHKNAKNKLVELVNILPHPMILYTIKPEDAESCKKLLNEAGYENVQTFTGKTSPKKRKNLIDDWKNNMFEIMIATSAFGVGVDKPDVRTVIHLYMPESPDTYYQELGRGGRDNLPCLSVMYVNNADTQSAHNYIPKTITPGKLGGRWRTMINDPTTEMKDKNLLIQSASLPEYNRKSILDEPSEKDSAWNLNVLLMLNRAGLIRINRIDVISNDKYMLDITVINHKILLDTDETSAILENVYQDEYRRANDAFGEMMKAVNKCGRLCWSEMFEDTYNLVSAYCAGCDAHEYIDNEEPNRFPLIKKVESPAKDLSRENMQFFCDSRESLFISKDSEDIRKRIDMRNPDVIVIDQDSTLMLNNIMPENPRLNIMNFKEFQMLGGEQDDYYTSGMIVAVYSSDPARYTVQYDIMHRYAVSRNGYVLHIASDDYYFRDVEKRFSEMIDGFITY
ncbi:MAG: DEAD/DEAH box helicase [Solobacterium sp.]|jgi:ATP-dependent DNA helicase RecQ|nr:DEAD/DEAH box helicase [Solobacterium sp.]MCH4048338.1 DEAD/DEAH box helicase [Solobacterium sp.]MCH4074810.1 DEAD/DEAH box helicase [Solobacterium sp.]